ncbi:FadR/GntR family transcriptional regulator [Streptomyces enissocaesilis]|uniref:GntR C-terminal domain-containing protein n=1 Tax=Streptomyces enissocaesilis TaxID=332589 RepID=A0ABN3XQ52_9ACTN
MRDALQIRCRLEPESAAEATRRKDDALVEDLAQLVARMEDAFSDPSAFLVADVAFHERIARAAGNRVLLRVIEAMREPAYSGSEFTSQTPAALRSGFEDHLRIHRAIAGGDPETVRSTTARHGT